MTLLLLLKVLVLSLVGLFVSPWTVACQSPLCMGFSRQEYWSGLPCPHPGDLPNPGIKLRSPSLQAKILYHLIHQEAQEHGSGEPILSPGDLPVPGVEPGSPTLQADSLLSDYSYFLIFSFVVEILSFFPLLPLPIWLILTMRDRILLSSNPMNSWKYYQKITSDLYVPKANNCTFALMFLQCT